MTDKQVTDEDLAAAHEILKPFVKAGIVLEADLGLGVHVVGAIIAQRVQSALAAFPPSEREIVTPDSSQADDATHLHIGADVDAARFGHIREELAKNQEYQKRIAELKAEAEESALQYLATAGQAQEALGEIAILKAQLASYKTELDRAAQDIADANTEMLEAKAQLAERDGQLVVLRGALSIIRVDAQAGACGDPVICSNCGAIEAIAEQALTSTASPAPQAIERIRQEARQEEREACAKVADGQAEMHGSFLNEVSISDRAQYGFEQRQGSAQAVAAQIRSQGHSQ